MWNNFLPLVTWNIYRNNDTDLYEVYSLCYPDSILRVGYGCNVTSYPQLRRKIGFKASGSKFLKYN